MAIMGELGASVSVSGIVLGSGGVGGEGEGEAEREEEGEGMESVNRTAREYDCSELSI